MATGGSFAPGSLLLAKYRVIRTLGTGAMGEVLQVRHADLGADFAMKVMIESFAKSEDLRARFVNEARMSATLKSDYIVQVSDVGRLDDGRPYMLMEMLHGEELQSLMEREKQLDVTAAVEFVLQTCEALAVAHSRFVTHRDLKPANLFVQTLPGAQSRIKVLDFGIAKLASSRRRANEAMRTATGTLLGTPLYMSPEQWRTEDVGHTADIWSLGAVFYEMLTGQAPFQAASVFELRQVVLETNPPLVTSLRPNVPDALTAAISRCLSKDPGARYASVAELASDLWKYGVTGAERRRNITSILSSKAELQNTDVDPAYTETVVPSGPLRPSNAVSSSQSMSRSIPSRTSTVATNTTAGATKKSRLETRTRVIWGGTGAGFLLLSAIFYAMRIPPLFAGIAALGVTVILTRALGVTVTDKLLEKSPIGGLGGEVAIFVVLFVVFYSPQRVVEAVAKYIGDKADGEKVAAIAPAETQGGSPTLRTLRFSLGSCPGPLGKLQALSVTIENDEHRATGSDCEFALSVQSKLPENAIVKCELASEDYEVVNGPGLAVNGDGSVRVPIQPRAALLTFAVVVPGEDPCPTELSERRALSFEYDGVPREARGSGCTFTATLNVLPTALYGAHVLVNLNTPHFRRGPGSPQLLVDALGIVNVLMIPKTTVPKPPSHVPAKTACTPCACHWPPPDKSNCVCKTECEPCDGECK